MNEELKEILNTIVSLLRDIKGERKSPYKPKGKPDNGTVITDLIVAAGPGGIGKRAMTRKTQWMTKPQRQAVLTSLLGSGYFESYKVAGSTYFRASIQECKNG